MSGESNLQDDRNRVVLVTGGAKRIGARIVARFHDSGYRVLIHCNQSVSDGEKLAMALNESREASADVVTQDLSDIEGLNTFVDKAASVFGRLDCLVNNASLFYPTPIDQLKPDVVDRFMNLNLTAPLLLSTAAARVMRTGSIINIIDVYAERPLHNYLAYSVSKAALTMATKALARELAPGIRVNGVSPGAILWPEDAAEMSDKDKADRLQGVPMGRLGEPEDVARAVVYLAEQGDYVTGQILSVDGGQSIV